MPGVDLASSDRGPTEARFGPGAGRPGRPGGAAAGPEAAPPPTDAATALLCALRARFGQFAGFVVEEIRSRRWSSVTFRGARHEIAFRLEGEGAQGAAERFLGGLDPGGLALRGHLVVDLSVAAQERRPGVVRIRLEALTVEDG